MDREPVLEVAMRAAVAGGSLLQEYTTDPLQISRKESYRDIVTEVDRLAEERIIHHIGKFNEKYPILTEESGQGISRDTLHYWIVDALDGTVNYVNHIPLYAVSIAFIEDGTPTVGVVYNPIAQDLYYGAEGIGVFKNKSRIAITDHAVEDCLFAMSFSGKTYNPSTREREFRTFGLLNDISRGCLRTGSAAMNLAYLADGRFCGCLGKANKIWDIAAGILLARLAGAQTTFRYVDLDGNLVNYLAAVPSAWDILARYFDALS
jgi:myo-inositol-1(or 4)-monophosphatase